MEIKNHISRYLIPLEATIREAMEVIDAGEERIGLLVDNERVLLKVVTDGDIRRAILKGAALSDKALDIHDREPFVLRDGQPPEEARRLLSKRITTVPVVDERNRVKGLIHLHDVQPFINVKSREVMILGMGFVGLTLGLVMADVGFSVTGYDINSDLLDQLNKKIPPFHEKGLASQLYKHVGQGLRFTRDLEKAYADIYIVTVGTPIVPDTQRPNIAYIEQAARSIGKLLKPNDLVVLRSTVPLGCTRKVVLPLLEEVSGLRAGMDFSLAFCPERTAEGMALHELHRNPQLVGGFDPQSTELASRLFNEITSTVIDAGSLEGAEMCKLMDNTYRDAIFGYANQMALICEKAGLNVWDLIEKVNLGYKRNLIPTPSPGVGGACLSKDPYILMSNFEEFALEAPITASARRVNEDYYAVMCDRAERLLGQAGKSLGKATVLLLGLAFKGEPETSDLRDATSVFFLKELRRRGVADIRAYDPVVKDDDLAALGVVPCSLDQGFAGADAAFILNNHRSYADMRVFKLLESMNKPALFFDGWNIFTPADIRNIPGIMYAGTGVG